MAFNTQSALLQVWDNPLVVTRHISWTKISSEGRVNNFSEKIEFPVYLNQPIDVGDYLTVY